jgi:hypothetical protein
MSLSTCFTSISKLKKCVRRHGSSIKMGIENEILGEHAIDFRQAKAVKQMVEQPKAMMYLNLDVKM